VVRDRLCLRFDHVFYGWVFFAVVMGLCMAVGWRFFDRPIHAPMIDPEAIARCPLVSSSQGILDRPDGRTRSSDNDCRVVPWLGCHGRSTRGASAAERLGAPTLPGWQRVAQLKVRLPLHGARIVVCASPIGTLAGQAVDVPLRSMTGRGKVARPEGSGRAPCRPIPDGPGSARARIRHGQERHRSGAGPEHRWCVTWYRRASC
jgi:hypothetical protein